MYVYSLIFVTIQFFFRMVIDLWIGIPVKDDGVSATTVWEGKYIYLKRVFAFIGLFICAGLLWMLFALISDVCLYIDSGHSLFVDNFNLLVFLFLLILAIIVMGYKLCSALSGKMYRKDGKEFSLNLYRYYYAITLAIKAVLYMFLIQILLCILLGFKNDRLKLFWLVISISGIIVSFVEAFFYISTLSVYKDGFITYSFIGNKGYSYRTMQIEDIAENHIKIFVEGREMVNLQASKENIDKIKEKFKAACQEEKGIR